MEGTTEDDSSARLKVWWEGLTEHERAEFRDLEAGDPFPTKHLTPYAQASLVVARWDDQQGFDYRANERLGAFLARNGHEPDWA